MKPSRVTRLVELLMLLQASQGHNTKTLAQTCGVSRRTIFRDLDILRQAGVPLHHDEEQQRYFIPTRSYLPATSFTADEALALMLLCYQLGDESGVPFLAPAQRAALKIESALPHALREHLRQVSPSVHIQLDARHPLDGAYHIYQQIVDACAKRHCVRIRYDSLADGEIISTRLSPYRVLFSRRSWYVIGRSSLYRATRTFHVGRVLSAETLSDTFQMPAGFSLDRYLRNAWHLIPEPGPDSDVHVHFQPKVAKNVAEVVWHKTQETSFRPDGSLDYRVRVSGLGEISWWVLGYGDQAEVIKPAPLREMVARHCIGLGTRYASEIKMLNGLRLAPDTSPS